MQARKESETSINGFRKSKLQEALDQVYGEYLDVLREAYDDMETRMAFAYEPNPRGRDGDPSVHADYLAYTTIRDLPSFAKTTCRNRFSQNREDYDLYLKQVREHPAFCSVEKIYSIAANLEAKQKYNNFRDSQEFLDQQFFENPGILAKQTKVTTRATRTDNVHEKFSLNFLSDQSYLKSTTKIRAIADFLDFTSISPIPHGFTRHHNTTADDLVRNYYSDVKCENFLQTLYNISALWYGQKRYDGFWGDTSYKPWLRREVAQNKLMETYKLHNRNHSWLNKLTYDLRSFSSEIYQSSYETPDGPLLGQSPFVSDGRWSMSEHIGFMERSIPNIDTRIDPENNPRTQSLADRFHKGTRNNFKIRHSNAAAIRGNISRFQVKAHSPENVGSWPVPKSLVPLYLHLRYTHDISVLAHEHPKNTMESLGTYETNRDARLQSTMFYDRPIRVFWTLMYYYYIGPGQWFRPGSITQEGEDESEVILWQEDEDLLPVLIRNLHSTAVFHEFDESDPEQVHRQMINSFSAQYDGRPVDQCCYYVNFGALLRNFVTYDGGNENYDRSRYMVENIISPTLKFYIYPRKTLSELRYFERLRLFANHLTEIYWQSVNPIIDNIVEETTASVVREVLNRANQAFLNTEVKFGIRLIQVLRSNLTEIFKDRIKSLNNGQEILKSLTEEERSFIVYDTNNIEEVFDGFSNPESEDVSKEMWVSQYEELKRTQQFQVDAQDTLREFRRRVEPLVCLPLVSHERVMDTSCAASPEILKEKYYKPSLRSSLREGLLATEEFKSLFEFVYPLNEFATIVNIFSLMILSSRQEMQELLDPTKAMLMATFETMTNRNDFGDKESALDHLGAVDILNSELFKQFMDNSTSEGPNMKCIELPNLGNFLKALVEQILNIIKYTPSIILRGIASVIDPCYMEMKQKHFSCGDEFVKNLKWSAISAKSEKKHKKLLDGSTGCDGGKKYVPLVPAFPIDLAYGIGTLDFESIGRSLKKFTTYIYKADLPWFNFDFQFDIPCLMDEPFQKKSEGGIDSNGRYGHPISPVTVLALSTPELPTEKNPSGCVISGTCAEPSPGQPTGREVREATEGCPDIAPPPLEEEEGTDNNPC